MRKLLSFIFLLFGCLLLSSCQKIEKIWIDSEDIVTSYRTIGATDLETMLANSSDFVLYISSASCTSCQDFKPILEEVIVDYQIAVLQIEAGTAFPTGNSVCPYTYTPTIVIFQDGEIMSKIDPITSEDSFSTVDGFVDYLNRYVDLTKK